MRYLLALLLLLPGAAQAATAGSFTDVRAQSTAAIASGDTTSAEVDLGGMMIAGLQMPGTFTGPSVKFLVSTTTGGTFQTLTDGTGSDVSKTVAASKYVGIDPTLFRGARFVKVVSASSEAAARSVTIISVPAK